MNQRVVMTSMGNPISSRCAASLGDCECVTICVVNPAGPVSSAAQTIIGFFLSVSPPKKNEDEDEDEGGATREYPLVEQIAEHVLVDDGARHVCAH